MITVAKIRRCRECSAPMYAREERYERYGTTVWYLCRNGLCPSAKRGYPSTEKRFERH